MHNEHWANDLNHEQKGKVARKLNDEIKKSSGGKHDLNSMYYKMRDVHKENMAAKAKNRMQPRGR